MIACPPTSYHERRHLETGRALVLSELKRDEARERLEREIRESRRHTRRLLRILEALG